MKPLIFYLAEVLVPTDKVNIPQRFLTSNTVGNALKILFAVSGAIAMIIIIIAALRYVLSQGDPQSTAKAKNAIIYAVVGLIICFTAYNIVTFALTKI